MLIIEDFDTQQMLIRVRGKGDKLRYTVFSQRCREVLREYVKQFKPDTYLFPGRNKPHISTEMIGHIVRTAAQRAGLFGDEKQWIPAGEKFFLPVKVVGRMFRGKFLAFLKEAYAEGRMDRTRRSGSSQGRQ